MKRIVKLKGELLIIAVISVILSWFISIMLYSFYKSSDKYDKESYYKALSENENKVEYIKDEIGNSDDDSVLEEKIRNIYLCNKNKQYKNIYLIDKEGNVIFKNNDYAISKFSIDDEGIKVESSEFNATNIISINDSRSIVFLNSDYIDNKGDSRMFIVMILSTFICFTLLVYGRINYINKISKNVKLIAKGNLNTKIPVKYKNELTDLADNINFMAKELSEQDTRQKEFITNISHDLRTPLTTILGYVDMIEEEKYTNADELKKYVSIIKRKSIYLKSMLEDFFMYSKLSSNDMEMNKVVINLNEGVRELLYGQSEEFKKVDLNLQLDLCSENIFIHADPLLISRAFENLISNAKKYSKKLSTVIISCNVENNYAVFKVKNIPNEPLENIDIDKLFYRMYKSDSSRNKGGSGLGLAITKEIVENHNGFINAEKNGKYLEFTIKLKEHTSKAVK